MLIKRNLWIIAIDTSGSMSERFSGKNEGPGITETGKFQFKIDAAKEYALKQISGLTNGDVAIIAFDSGTRLICEGSIDYFDDCIEPVKELQANGNSTNIASALLFSLDKFILSNRYEKVWIQVITDGLSNDGNPVVAANDCAEKSAKAKVQLVINNILIDPSDEGESIARAICKPSGGEVRSVTSFIKLDVALEDQRIKYQKSVQKAQEERFQKIITSVGAVLGLAVVMIGILNGLVEKPLIIIPITIAAMLAIGGIVLMILAFGKEHSKNAFYRGPRDSDLGFPKPSWKYSKKLRTYALVGGSLCFIFAAWLVFLSYTQSSSASSQLFTATPSLTPTATPSLTPTATPSLTPTATPSLTPTATPTITGTVTALPTITLSP